jgi:oligo-1,6-glucosidase
MTTATEPPKWWKDVTGYQIWPASYKDSNDDGLGDIPGITSTLDYLIHLGVDFIWLSPVYDSPHHDAGYDARDYESIWAKYGTLDDMDTLIREVHVRGMRIVMDLVVNHTSNEHTWFPESKKSKSNPYSNWYIWGDPKYEGADRKRQPPNNWRAAFGGSYWTYVPEQDQYYLHLCLPEQPDLNWQNGATRREIYASAIEFWLKKGIDGFCVDVVNFYWNDPSFPDAKVVHETEEYQPMEPQHIISGPKMHDWLREQRIEALGKYGEDVVLIGELPGTSREEVLRYVSAQSRELDMVFDFDIYMTAMTGTRNYMTFRHSSYLKLRIR